MHSSIFSLQLDRKQARPIWCRRKLLCQLNSRFPLRPQVPRDFHCRSISLRFYSAICHLAGNGASVLVIGVAGGSGGGKSVFCKKLKSIVSNICPTVVLR